MSDLVLVIAGGEWQAPIIKKLQSYGYQVLNINLYSNTKGASIANIFEQADVTDKNKCLKIAKKYKPIAVLTDQSDISVATVAFIAKELSLTGIGVECAHYFTNKLAMRDKAQSLGIFCPEYGTAFNLEEVQIHAINFGYPIIIKPINSQSSRGVSLVKCVDELMLAVDAALSFSRPESPILVEQYIDGQEWTVEGFKNQNKHVSLAVSYKKHFKSHPTIASSLTYEPLEPKGKHKQLIEQNNRLVDGFKLPFGITHAEYKLYDGKYFLIEIAARGGGAKISSDIIPLMSGVDVNKLLIESVTNKSIGNVEYRKTGTYAMLAFLNFSPGKVLSFTAESIIKSLSFVIDFKYNFNIGDIIRPIEDDSTRHAHVLLSADNSAGLQENLTAIKNMIKIIYD